MGGYGCCGTYSHRQQHIVIVLGGGVLLVSFLEKSAIGAGCCCCCSIDGVILSAMICRTFSHTISLSSPFISFNFHSPHMITSMPIAPHSECVVLCVLCGC